MEPATRNGQQPPFAIPCPEQAAAQPDGATATVPLSRIAPPSHDVKPDRTPEDILQKLESIRQQGVLNPLFVFLRADGLYEIIDGLTRYLALLMGGFREAPIRALGRIPAPDEILEMQVTCNIAHAPMSDLQLADAIARHQKLTGGTQAATCKALGISAARGSKIMAIFTKLPAEVQAMVSAGELAPRSGYALSRLTDIPVVIDLAKKARDVPWAVETVEAKVAALLGNGRKTKAKPLKLRLDGVQMTANNPTLDGVQAFAERLLAALRKLAKDGDSIEFLSARLKAP